MGCNKKLSVNFIVAHAGEAKPLINYFKLKKNHQHKAISIFQSEHIRLAVSGQGRTNAAIATAYLGAIAVFEKTTDIWINFGIAGHNSHPLGSLWRIHKVIEQASGLSMYPLNLCKIAKINSEQLMTTDYVEHHYSQTALYDMEAMAFFQAARKFSTMELIQSFKVVSDNSVDTGVILDHKRAKGLLEPVVKRMDDYIVELKKILTNNVNNSNYSIDIKEIYSTQSEKIIIQELADSLIVHGHEPQQLVNQCDSAADLIKRMRAKLNTVELTL